MEPQNKNPFKLKIGQKCLIKHVPSDSNWLPVEITHFTEAGYPWGESRNLSGIIGEDFEVDVCIPEEDSKLTKALSALQFYNSKVQNERFEFNLANMLKFASDYADHVLGTAGKKKAEDSWLERATRDKHNYPNEENAFNYYWQMSH